MATGCTWPSASTIGCSSEPWKGSTSRPSVVVPSGNIAITSPWASTSAAWRLTLCVSWRRARSMNSVPALVAKRPTSGQRFNSDLAMKRAGWSVFSTKMSSQET